MTTKNREIKFRAWDKRLNKMVYEYLTIEFWRNQISTKDRVMMQPLEEFVLLQFTGLCDKNGKEIYEGDIVKFNGKTYKDTDWRVDFWFGTFGITDLKDIAMSHSFQSLGNMDMENIEIIGNIYETPELLTQEEK